MNMRTLALTILASAATTALAGGPAYEIDWYTIDGGGETFSTGGQYELGGTIGQADANQSDLTGGAYRLTGGFWAVPPDFCPGDADGDDDVDFADLEILLDQWGSAGPEADFNGSGRVDFGDLDILLDEWGEICN